MANLVNAVNTLDRIKKMVDMHYWKRADSIEQTPDGRPPVYWPITIHGKTGMMQDDRLKKIDPTPPAKA
jgi:hypothetical protein